MKEVPGAGEPPGDTRRAGEPSGDTRCAGEPPGDTRKDDPIGMTMATMPRPQTAQLLRRRLHIHGLVLPCNIGVHAHEKGRQQRVRIHVDLAVEYGDASLSDDIANVLSYDGLTEGIGGIVGAGHINLVETLADRIADMCLLDLRVSRARVVVEKLDVLTGDAVVGAETEIVRKSAGSRASEG